MGDIDRASHAIQVRVLNDGGVVSKDDNGVERDHLGDSYSDTFNFRNGVVTRDPDNHRQVNIDLNCYDIMLDPAGDATFTSGSDVRVFSTLQAAIDCATEIWVTLGRQITIWVCPNDTGSYGNGTILAANGFNTLSASFTGTGYAAIWNFGEVASSIGSITVGSASVNPEVVLGFHSILVGVITNFSNDFTINAEETFFSGLVKGVGGATNPSLNSSSLISCQSGSITQTRISASQFIGCQIEAIVADVMDDVMIDHPQLVGKGQTAGSYTAFVQINDSFTRVSIVAPDQTFVNGVANYTLVYLKLANALGISGINNKGLTVDGGTILGVHNHTTYLIVEDGGAATPENVIVQGVTTMPDPTAGTFKGATGAFTNSVFGPNAPDNLDYSGVTGTGNVFYTSGSIPSGGAGPASNADAFVTIGHPADLSAERALTAGNGVGFTDGGANSTVTLKLVDLTGNWTQAGVFDISQAGNLTVLKHAAIGAGSAIDPATILSLQETFADPSGARQALAGNAIATLTADNANALAGLSYTALVTGAHTLSGIVSAVRGTAMAGSGATLSDARVFDAIGGLFLTAAATMTKLALFYGRNPAAANLSVGTLYGLYLENLAKGTTNWAIASLGGKSYFAGAMRIGGTAGSAETAPDAQAVLELNGSGLGLLLPRMATASAPSGAADGMLWYDSTTARLRGRENALDRNVLQRLSKTITVLSPLAADNINMGDFLPACTVEEVRVVLVGSATPSTSYNLVYSTDRSAAGTKLWTADKTTTSTTTGDTFTSFDNPAMGADVWLRLVMSAVSGTVTEISVTVWYRET